MRLVNERILEVLNGVCTLRGVLRLREPDRDGCNWLEGGYQGIYTEGFRQALGEIRSKYNLEDEPGAFAPSPVETQSHPWIRLGARSLPTSRRSR